MLSINLPPWGGASDMMGACWLSGIWYAETVKKEFLTQHSKTLLWQHGIWCIWNNLIKFNHTRCTCRCTYTAGYRSTRIARTVPHSFVFEHLLGLSAMVWSRSRTKHATSTSFIHSVSSLPWPGANPRDRLVAYSSILCYVSHLGVCFQEYVCKLKLHCTEIFLLES